MDCDRVMRREELRNGLAGAAMVAVEAVENVEVDDDEEAVRWRLDRDCFVET